MSLSLILKNIYSFLNVLEQAHCKRVAAWDVQSLGNAFRWATYCEKIYDHARGKSYSTELDRQIISMGSLPWSLGNIRISLDLLHSATSTLTKTLLQNCHLSRRLYELVVTQHPTPHLLLQECWQINRSKAALQIGVTLKKHVLPSGDCQTNSRMDHMTHSEATVLVYYIDKVLAKSELHRTRCEDILRDKLNCLCNSLSPQAHELRVATTALSLVHQTVEPPLQAPTQTEQLLLHHLLNLPQQQLGKLWTLPQDLMCQLCASYVSIYTLYMRHLVTMADTVMTHSDTGTSTHQHDRCHPVSKTDTYHNIRTCLMSLLHAGKQVSMATRKSIESLAQGSEGTIWEQLLNDTIDCGLPE
ncbi:hypothetical protein LSAT2_028831 [Lamellibrachia satsuma]|nr:hypothetical protein LSAT2_028831 [Lamellibrachia satsuma]